MQRPRRTTVVGRVLEAAEAASPVEAIDGVAHELGLAFGAASVSFLIMDKSGRALARLAHVPLVPALGHGHDPLVDGERRDDAESATVIPLDGGPPEQALRTQTVQVLPTEADAAGGLWRVLAPVTERGESIGLLEMYLPQEPDHGVVAEIAEVAHLLAFVVIANRRHTDLFEWGQRGEDYSLSAEIQQRLLPSARTCEAASFTLAGWLEPAASIGGDTFDYSLGRDSLYLSLTDAMGHGVDAALTASMCLGGLRGARRRGMTLLEQAAATNEALAAHASRRAGDDFVTGLLGRVDLGTGTVEVINAGHVAPYVLRGSELISPELRVDLPLGMFSESTYGSTRLSLEPGDRVVLVTDGMLERNVAGIDLPGAIKDSRDLHPREVVRALADSALAAAGHSLQDDATVMVLDWHGERDTARVSVAGADRSRASEPLA
ncbi:PP2C family protein-serine/threonine phosphatase [Nocardioides pacificus]